MNKQTFMLTFSALCIGINLILGTMVQMLKIPLIFLDTLGTIFGAVLLGPFYGAIIGLLTNVTQGVLTNPKDIPFALVNVAIGLIVGFIARKYKFDLKTAIGTGLILSVVAPLIGTPIAIWIYGGLTGGGTDFIFLWLVKSGQEIFTAAFLPRIVGNLVDKIACAVLVSLVVARLPVDLLAKGNNPFYNQQF